MEYCWSVGVIFSGLGLGSRWRARSRRAGGSRCRLPAAHQAFQHPVRADGVPTPPHPCPSLPNITTTFKPPPPLPSSSTRCSPSSPDALSTSQKPLDNKKKIARVPRAVSTPPVSTPPVSPLQAEMPEGRGHGTEEQKGASVRHVMESRGGNLQVSQPRNPISSYGNCF